MDLGSLLVMLALAVLVAAFIARPLFEGSSPPPAATDPELSAKRAELDRILGLIQDLEMDFAMAKVLPDDYRTMRPELVHRGADLMRELDRAEGNGHGPAEGVEELEAEIEAEIARLRGGAGVGPAGFCGSCGHAVLSGDKFCVRCGAPLAIEEAGA
jgi:hypothetical protein